MLAALEATLGVVTLACKKAGVKRSTHYRWMQEDEEYREQVDDIANIALDFAESKLHEKIKSGDTTSIIFYLKSKGKKRGYTERIEYETDANVSLSGGVPIDAWIKNNIKK
jgi:predicted transcriptional regulator